MSFDPDHLRGGIDEMIKVQKESLGNVALELTDEHLHFSTMSTISAGKLHYLHENTKNNASCLLDTHKSAGKTLKRQTHISLFIKLSFILLVINISSKSLKL